MRPPTNPMQQPNGFNSQPNFRQPMQSNLGVNGQPQSGNISLGQTYGGLVKGGLNAAASFLIPGYSAARAYTAGTQPQVQASPARPPIGVNSAQAATMPQFQTSQGNGGSAWTPTADQYGNPTGVGNFGVGGGGNSQPQTPQVANMQDTPDRFAQLNALRDSAASYYQPTQDEQNTMQQYGNLLESRDLGLAKISNNPEPMDLITGQSAYLQKQAEAQAQPLQAKLGILQARRQAAISGYQAALGAEQAKLGYQQPVSLGLGQALVSPTTGQTVAGNAAYTGSGGNSLIDSAIQQLKSGASYSDVASQLPGGLAPMLLSEAQKQIPGFNITQSNQNAGARAQQLNQNVTLVQPLKLAMQTALDHIGGLQDVINKVNYSNSGIVNNIRAGISDNISSDQNIKTLQSQIPLVRSEVAKVLGGGNVTVESQHEAESIIPMNISPSQFKTVIQQVKDRMQEKIDEYSKLGNPAQYGSQSSNQSSGGMFGSFF